jgi:hypothetical protein
VRYARGAGRGLLDEILDVFFDGRVTQIEGVVAVSELVSDFGKRLE